MENRHLQFRTNINCSGCVAAVTPHLDKANGIGEWNVDTASSDKMLTIQSAGITEEEVLHLINKTGFKATPLIPSINHSPNK